MTIVAQLEKLDHALFFVVNNGLASDQFDEVFRGLSSLGSWTILLIAIAFLAADGWRTLLRHMAAILLALLLATTINNGIKRSVQRPRPAVEFSREIGEGSAEVRMPGEQLYRKSFPSGHSLLAFLAMTYVALARPAYRFFALLLASLVALSRVYMGVHFPSDILVGSILGIAGGWFAWFLFRRIELAFPPKTVS